MPQSDSPILLLDHAGAAASVAVVDGGGVVLASSLESRPQMQAERLSLMVKDCLREAALHPSQLGAIACQRGPGSYTGLRIGAALAQGIALPWGIPLLGVSTLEAMAWGWWHEEPNRLQRYPKVIPMVDARRMEVFCGVYSWNYHSIETLMQGSALILQEDSLSSWAGHDLAFLGDGVAKWEALLAASLQNHQWNGAAFVQGWQSTASSWAGLALHYRAAGRSESPEHFRVDYHKDFYSPSP